MSDSNRISPAETEAARPAAPPMRMSRPAPETSGPADGAALPVGRPARVLDPTALRLLTVADLPAYKALRDRMLSRHDHAFTSDAATEQSRDASSYRSRLHAEAGGRAMFTLGAWLGDQLVGVLTCEAEERPKVRHVAHLVGMMVDDDHQGRGIGRALLKEAIARLLQAPWLELVTLSVTASNAPAVALYRSEGFVAYGVLPRAIRQLDGHYLSKQLMMLSLRESQDAQPDFSDTENGSTLAL